MTPPSGSLPTPWQPAPPSDLGRLTGCQTAKGLRARACACARVRARARRKTPKAGSLAVCPAHNPLDLGSLPGSLPYIGSLPRSTARKLREV
jgi:hypothetical protein